MKRYFYLALSVVLIFTACTKTSTPSLTRLDMLRKGKWKLSSGSLAVKLPNGKDTSLNYLTYLPSCILDNYFTFSSSTSGEVFSGSNKCSLSDPDSTQFSWAFTNNNNNISFFRGFNLIWSVTETINYIKFDTTSYSPLVIDTVHGVNDTLPGFSRVIVVLDSTWNLTFVRDSVPNFNIDNALITDFSQSSFSIYFTMYSTYPDSTNHHTGLGYFADPAAVGGMDTVDLQPIIRPDTFKYKLTYTNF